MNGASQLDSAALVGAGTGWTAIRAVDLDGDSRADLIWEHADGTTSSWLMAGTTARAYGNFLGANTGWHLAATADLDGNGKADLVWRKDDGSYGVWVMNGAQASSYGSFFGPNTGWEVLR